MLFGAELLTSVAGEEADGGGDNVESCALLFRAFLDLCAIGLIYLCICTCCVEVSYPTPRYPLPASLLLYPQCIGAQTSAHVSWRGKTKKNIITL